MSDRLLERCAAELERKVAIEYQVELQFNAMRGLPDDIREEIPFIGGEYSREQHADLMRLVIRALACQYWFGLEEQFLPPLPLHPDAISKMQNNRYFPWWGDFAQLQRDSEWDFRRHNSFGEFAARCRQACVAREQVLKPSGNERFPC